MNNLLKSIGAKLSTVLRPPCSNEQAMKEETTDNVFNQKTVIRIIDTAEDIIYNVKTQDILYNYDIRLEDIKSNAGLVVKTVTYYEADGITAINLAYRNKLCFNITWTVNIHNELYCSWINGIALMVLNYIIKELDTIPDILDTLVQHKLKVDVEIVGQQQSRNIKIALNTSSTIGSSHRNIDTPATLEYLDILYILSILTDFAKQL